MQRILEPEVMDSPAEAGEYDQMDFTEVNNAFAAATLNLAPPQAQVLDAGTGTARIPILMVQQRPGWQITAIDLATSMLDLAKINVAAARLEEQIRLEVVDAKAMPYPDGNFDLVVSNSLVHHLQDPLPFLKEIKRVLKPTGQIFLRDLLRPPSLAAVEALLTPLAAAYSPRQRQLFYDSLCAAFTLSEMQELFHAAGFSDVSPYPSSERHWSAQRNNSFGELG
jgi:ubiquinone/menaquinone biosynthesis C-methylase UbiE